MAQQGGKLFRKWAALLPLLDQQGRGPIMRATGIGSHVQLQAAKTVGLPTNDRLGRENRF